MSVQGMCPCVFANNSPYRRDITLRPEIKKEFQFASDDEGKENPRSLTNYTWSKMLAQVSKIDVTKCVHCLRCVLLPMYPVHTHTPMPDSRRLIPHARCPMPDARCPMPALYRHRQKVWSHPQIPLTSLKIAPNHQRTKAEPHIKPAPKAVIQTTSLALTRPPRTASSKHMGMEAAEQLP